MAEEQKEVSVALAFVHALVASDSDTAFKMLSSQLQRITSSEELRTQFEAMMVYTDGPVQDVQVLAVDHDWSKRDSHSVSVAGGSDIARVYIGICGDGFSEAVDTRVTWENGRPVISEVIWGRP